MGGDRKIENEVIKGRPGLYQKIPNTPSSTPGGIPKEDAKYLERLFINNIDSYNFMIDEGLQRAIDDISPVEFVVGEDRLRICVRNYILNQPHTKNDELDPKLYPHTCREAGTTYGGTFLVTYYMTINEGDPISLDKNMGEFPIMVKSKLCNLYKMTPQELCRSHEDPYEQGGYFICNGIDRIIRMLQLPKRNYPIALIRSSFKNRDNLYTDKGVQIRCVKPDQSSVTNVLHYLRDGNMTMKFTMRKREFLIPAGVLLKALRNSTDEELYLKLLQNRKDSFLSDRIALLLRENHKSKIFNQEEALRYLGNSFKLSLGLLPTLPDEDAGDILLRKFILVHLPHYDSKYELLILMINKLMKLVSGNIMDDNADSLMNHDILLSGHLICMYLKDKLEDSLITFKSLVIKDFKDLKMDLTNINYFNKVLKKLPEIGNKMYYFLATGTLVSRTGLDLMQVTGYTVVADKLNNFRYYSHFRAVHRGQFFTEQKTTSVRKLLPESYGFLCPVHTPDGAPCGLLNHLACDAEIVTRPSKIGELIKVLVELGVLLRNNSTIYNYDVLPVLVNGDVIGYIEPEQLSNISNQLRIIKLTGQYDIPKIFEIAAIPYHKKGGLFSGLFISSDAGRLIRPVRHIKTNKVDYISPLEQVYLDINISEDNQLHSSIYSELTKYSMLSLLGSLTVYSENNQSPRNIYQCQMCKQTIGTYAYSHQYRTDGKTYRIGMPQSPIVQTDNQKKYKMDNYPNGTNAVVAVIAYTGYDMDDGMIINQASFMRGFGHGTVFKCEALDLNEGSHHNAQQQKYFKKASPDQLSKFDLQNKTFSELDDDGLPPVGLYLHKGDCYYCYIDPTINRAKIGIYKSSEPAYIDTVRIIGKPNEKRITTINIKFRFNRNPVVGDKFSSRHGQKGVLSVLWPQIDMPFTDSGIVPDVIINPHAFPSRMTIGMLIECMAGKAGSVDGIYHDGTPFNYSEKERAIDFLGKQLLKSGYQYYGTESMYSGTLGTVMEAQIFIGVVYYQRLRHMVSDKSQARNTGPSNALTNQPVKGRKKGGGIRFGEMERDSLISHGAAFLLHDRLLNVSDRHETYVCKTCGSILSPTFIKKIGGARDNSKLRNEIECRYCDDKINIYRVVVPYVFRYLVNELCGMNIKIKLDVRDL